MSQKGLLSSVSLNRGCHLLVLKKLFALIYNSIWLFVILSHSGNWCKCGILSLINIALLKKVVCSLSLHRNWSECAGRSICRSTKTWSRLWPSNAAQTQTEESLSSTSSTSLKNEEEDVEEEVEDENRLSWLPQLLWRKEEEEEEGEVVGQSTNLW